MFAEKRPPGFALMALCRLNSDRFFTTDYRPEIYTQLGLEWIGDTTFSALLLRHYSHLQACLQGVTHAFTPWTKATPAQGALEVASVQSAPALPAREKESYHGILSSCHRRRDTRSGLWARY